MTDKQKQPKPNYGPWFRLYVGLLHDPKVQTLPPELFKAWINLLCIAAENDGRLPTSDVLAYHMRVTPAVSLQTIDTLKSRGLFDIVDGIVTPHNWSYRQYKIDAKDPTSAKRSRRYRDKNRRVTTVTERDGERDGHAVTLVSPPVSVTATIADTDTETEQSRAEIPSPPAEVPAAALPALPVVVIPTPPKKARPRGAATRIAPDFVPDAAEAARIGLTGKCGALEAEKFLDHFRSVPDGRGGLKVDWQATWRNWCRRALNDGGLVNGKAVGTGGERPSRDPNAAVFGVLADIAAEGRRIAGWDADPDGPANDHAGAAADDPAQIVNLGREAVRRSG